MDTKLFIREVMQRPGIWMVKHPDYNKRERVRQLWLEVKRRFPEYEVEELRKKWKNLKDNYRKEAKKFPMSHSTDPAQFVLKSHWKYFDLLTFVDEVEVPVQGEPNVEKETTNIEAMEQESEMKIENETREVFLPDEEWMEQQPKLEPISAELQDPSELQVPIESQPPLELQAPQELLAPRELQAPTEPGAPPSPQPSSSSSRRSSVSTNVPIEKSKHSSKPPNQLRAEFLEIERKKLKLLEREVARSTATSNNIEERKSDDYYFLMSLLPQIETLTVMQRMRLRNKFNQALMDELALNEFHSGYYTHVQHPGPSHSSHMNHD